LTATEKATATAAAFHADEMVVANQSRKRFQPTRARGDGQSSIAFSAETDELARLRARLEREAAQRFGAQRVAIFHAAPVWRRAVRNGYPIIFADRCLNLFCGFAGLIDWDPEIEKNWHGFLRPAERAKWRAEFLPAVTAWVLRVFDIRNETHLQQAAVRAGGVRSVDLNGPYNLRWDGGRSKMNPQIADELTVVALCVSEPGPLLARGLLELLLEFYSLPQCVEIRSKQALREIIRSVIETRADFAWTRDYPLTALWYGGDVPMIRRPGDPDGVQAWLDSLPVPSTVSDPLALLRAR
jgi:hypothetical protein